MHHFICLGKANEFFVFKLINWVVLTATFSFILCILQVLCTNTCHWPCTSIHSDFIKQKFKVKKEEPFLHGVFPPQNAKTCCYNGMDKLNKWRNRKIPTITRESKQEKIPLISLYWPKILLPEKTRTQIQHTQKNCSDYIRGTELSLSYQYCCVGHSSDCSLHHCLWLLNYLCLWLWLWLGLGLLHGGLLGGLLARLGLLGLGARLLLGPLLLRQRLQGKGHLQSSSVEQARCDGFQTK